MIPWIQKTFHTDKWWGKSIFVTLTYTIFWCLFYGLFFLIPDSDTNTDFVSNLGFIYTLFLIPILSFFILPKFIKKTFYMKSWVLYTMHTLLMLLSIAVFIFFLVRAAFSNYSGL